MNGIKKMTIPYILIREEKVYYLVSESDHRDKGWCIKNKSVFASSQTMEGCNHFDKVDLENLLFDEVAEKWVILSLPHRIPHKKAFIEGYKKALDDFLVPFKNRIAEVEAERVWINGVEGWVPKIVNGEIKIVSVK